MVTFSLARKRLAALVFGLALAVPFAAAQQTPTPSEPTPTVEKDEPEAAEVAEVVITGSRIRRTEFTSASPVTIITAERSALAGLISTEEILRGSTAAAGQQVTDAFSGFITDGGPGANSISLRGLGAQRTLVLVNGKRWSPSGIQGRTNTVDFTAIPSSTISRIEILKDGASSVYGADAVAGVINIITKESLDGFQLNVQTSTSDEFDGSRYSFDGSFGQVFDRGSFSISANYAEQQNLTRTSRDWLSCDRDPRITDQDGDGVIDNTDPFTGEPLCLGFIYGLANTALGFLRYEPSLATPTPANRYFDPRVNGVFGIPFYTRLPLNGLSPISPPATTMSTPPLNPLFDNDGAYYNDLRSPAVEDLQPKSKLFSLTSFGQLDFDLGGGQSTAYYEAYWNSRSTDILGGYRQFFPFVEELGPNGAPNPLNPFNATGLPPGFRFAQPVLPTYEILDPSTKIDISRYNAFAGLRGDFIGGWEYDAFIGYGRSEGSYRDQQLLDDRVEAAINNVIVDPMSGQIRCSDAALAALPGCVPANLFTRDALLNGRLPANVLAFLRKDTRGETVYSGTTASAYLTGSVFTLPAGDAKAVFGAEWRRESIDDVPDEDAQNNNYWGFSTAGITRGTDSVREAFVEFEAPLLKGKKFAESMTVNLSGRYTDYDSYGADETYRVSLDYVIAPLVSVRSTYGTSFRAPDLYEQFLADQIGFVSNLSDPCVNYGNRSNPGDPLFDNCASQGLAPDFFNPESIVSITGGADDLGAETSDAFTFGIVLKPEALNVSLAVDYFDISIADTVESPGVGFILGTCYDSANFSSPFCNRVGPRDALDVLSFVDASFVNVGRQISRGVDINFLFDKEFEIGRLIVDLDATYLIEQNFELFGETTQLAGRWGYPRWSAQTETRFDWRDWRLAWFMDFTGESAEIPVRDPGTSNIDRTFRTPNTLYHAFSVRYAAADWEIIGSVRNAFDKDPPFVSGGQNADGATRFFNTLPGVGYDLFGRTFVLQASTRF